MEKLKKAENSFYYFRLFHHAQMNFSLSHSHVEASLDKNWGKYAENWKFITLIY